MTQVHPFTALLAANTQLRVLDPIAGPLERPAEQLTAADEVLVFVGGRPCYRPVAQISPSTPPDRAVMLSAGSLSPGIPSRDLAIASRQVITIAFPAGTPPVPADELLPAQEIEPSSHWIELTVQDAEGIVAEGMLQRTGALAAEIVPEPPPPAEEPTPEPVSEPAPAPTPQTEAPPLRAHAGSRELSPHSAEVDGILSTWCFTVPPRTTTIRLSSASVQPDGDPRHLGVAIVRLAMGDVSIPLDSPALVRGFHRAEANDELTWRWTDGEALMILPPRPHEQVLLVVVTSWHKMLAKG